jgi:hypothetical protein
LGDDTQVEGPTRWFTVSKIVVERPTALEGLYDNVDTPKRQEVVTSGGNGPSQAGDCLPLFLASSWLLSARAARMMLAWLFNPMEVGSRRWLTAHD